MRVTVHMVYDTNNGQFNLQVECSKPHIRRDVLYTMKGRFEEILYAQAMEDKFVMKAGANGPSRSNIQIVPGNAEIPPHPSER